MHTERRTGACCFPSTRWSLVDDAGDGGRAAMEALLRRYLPAMRAYLVLERRIDPDRALDLIQGFISDKIYEQNLVAGADRAKGRFRSFLLAALRHYVSDQARREAAQSRSPGRGAALIPLDGCVEPTASPGQSPPDAFDVAWAREVVAEAVRRMRDDCGAAGRGDLWELFEGRLLAPAVDGAEPVPYEKLVERFGFASPAQAFNALVTAKRMFVRVLRGVVGEYAGEGETAEDEIRELRAILARARLDGRRPRA